LLSYSKIFIKTKILESSLVDEDRSIDFLYKYFPKSFVSVYENEIKAHPLRRQIIATFIADTVINLQGTSFIHDYKSLGPVKFLDKIRSYLISNDLFGANDIRYEIFRHDYDMPLETQYRLLGKIERTLIFSTKWMLNYLDSEQIDSAHILDYKERLFNRLNSMNKEPGSEILPDNPGFNRFFTVIDFLRFAVAAIILKEHNDSSFENVADLFYLIFEEMKIMKLLKILDEIKLNEDADRELKAQMLHYIEYIVVNLTKKILNFQRVGESPDAAFKNYRESNLKDFESTKNQIETLLKQEHKEIKEVIITVNKLMGMAI